MPELLMLLLSDRWTSEPSWQTRTMYSLFFTAVMCVLAAVLLMDMLT